MALTIHATIRKLTSPQRNRRKAEMLISLIFVGIAIYIWKQENFKFNRVVPVNFSSLVIVYCCSQAISIFLLHLYDLIGHYRVTSKLDELDHLPDQAKQLAMLGNNRQDPFMFIRYWGLLFPFFATLGFLSYSSKTSSVHLEYKLSITVAAVIIFWVFMTFRKRKERL